MTAEDGKSEWKYFSDTHVRCSNCYKVILMKKGVNYGNASKDKKARCSCSGWYQYLKIGFTQEGLLIAKQKREKDERKARRSEGALKAAAKRQERWGFGVNYERKPYGQRLADGFELLESSDKDSDNG